MTSENSFDQSRKLIDEQYNRPRALTEEERENPMIFLGEFYSIYHLRDAQDTHYDLTKAAIGSDTAEFVEGSHRSNTLFFHDNIARLLEASYILWKREEATKQNFPEG